jgi:hypothetical protein
MDSWVESYDPAMATENNKFDHRDYWIDDGPVWGPARYQPMSTHHLPFSGADSERLDDSHRWCCNT